MTFSKKKQLFLLSNGSVTFEKTFLKTSNKIEILEKDYINWTHNAKNAAYSYEQDKYRSFKTKFIQNNFLIINEHFKSISFYKT